MSMGVGGRNGRTGAGRLRVMGWMLISTAVSLALLIVAVAFVLRAGVDSSINEAMEQEVGEISRFATDGIDPDTGKPFTSVDRFLQVYLDRQQAARAELIVGLGQRGYEVQSVGQDAARWGDLPPGVRDTLSEPGSMGTRRFGEAMASGPVGRVTWDNHEVRVGNTTGLIVLVRFHDPLEADVQRQLVVLSALAVAALLATGAGAWFVAGRVLRPVAEFEREAARVGEGGERLRLVEQGSDEYVRLARAGNQMLERADAAVADQQQFSDDLAHALRTPLAIAHGRLEDLVAGGADGVAAVLDEVVRLERATSSLVLLNRAGRADFVVPQVVAGDEVLRDLVVRWAHALGAGATEKVVLGQAAAVPLQVDVGLVERGFDELVSNAVEAVRGGGRVVVSSVVEDQELVVRVTDTGAGVPQGEGELVFERFARSSTAPDELMDPGAGSGLGLAVARVVFEAHGGAVRLLGVGAGDGAGAGAARGGVAEVRLPLAEG
ncbi:HAMP domain-containing sensor histidine kinase [Propionibacteriaceae bacterium G1746]|uniref:sensor histidine kinase n=1 Tax=Aestuariimicrobium sp. G57 TaxID=3418485 RepID=UPI003C1EF593